MSARRCLPFLFVPLLLLLVACADAQEAVDETPAASPTAQASETPTATLPAEDTPTPTPSGIGPVSPTETAPPGLPPAAAGYKWIETTHFDGFRLKDYELVDYALEVPSEWTALQGNPQLLAPPGYPLVGQFSPRMIVRVTSAEVVVTNAFTINLPWQGGLLCGILRDGELNTTLGKWMLFAFKCPTDESGYCQADSVKEEITCTTTATVDGRAAEVRVGSFYYSVTAFQPGATADSEAAFQRALDSFTSR